MLQCYEYPDQVQRKHPNLKKIKYLNFEQILFIEQNLLWLKQLNDTWLVFQNLVDPIRKLFLQSSLVIQFFVLLQITVNPLISKNIKNYRIIENQTKKLTQSSK